MAGSAAIEAVDEIIARQQRRRRDHDGAQFHRRQHHLPQRHDIAEHQQDAVAAPDPERPQMVRDPVRPLGYLGKAQPLLAAALVDDPQREAVIALRHRVEIVERPVEPVEHRPAEIAVRGLVIGAMGQQEVARFEELGCRHRFTLPVWPDGRMRRPKRQGRGSLPAPPASTPTSPASAIPALANRPSRPCAASSPGTRDRSRSRISTCCSAAAPASPTTRSPTSS